ncbi:hypothetical protein A2765_00520 [Candidatus Kaiserbacteria bacterium RIFCSPHIGHO2_01_FULL_56_24]|uniref:Cupin type-1 domain-containing protein n=1 Tax=Candidatus Kaiserbacteria bacterium RIFCSPHIGHO2_01_FULL_56_24 TaxID=1798487 RepID=A0A1F6DBW6_9BACT|nr:MAG: hypothetical protein A2765_00520 [Candidatus Kaiserbacteria bacterium RIFCSPHIGHO2_01_FULL_56_24]
MYLERAMNNEYFDRIEKGEAYVEGSPYITHQRHWGSSVVLDANTRIHFIVGEPSAHFHKYRTEDYILHAGDMVVYRGPVFEGDLEKTISNLEEVHLRPGDRVVIPPQTVHIPINSSPEGSTFVEISHGPYAEEDIVRVYDKNGRDSELVKKWLELGYEEGISVKDLIPLIRGKFKNSQ